MAIKSSEMSVTTRFAPSPTGLLHAGNYRTAIFSYIFAQQAKGNFVLRVEDTDRARSKKEYEDNILDSLQWLNITFNEFFRQSERTDIHKSYIQKLIDSGHAYISKETPKEDGGRTEVIRFKNPNKKIVFDDMIRGSIEFDTTELGDFIIAKSLTEPVFHLVVVVDDFLMGVTHIIRGEDHISNTPRHILIQEAIGAPRPLYAHLPLVLAPDKSKLSKRKGALAITEYRERGYLPEALVNFLALLGWNPGTEQEFFTMDELIATFDLSKVQKSGAVFNEEKLKWFNKHYISKLTPEEYLSHAARFMPEEVKKSETTFIKIALMCRERISTFGELREMSKAGDFEYFFQAPVFSKEKLLWKDEKNFDVVKKHIEKVIELLKSSVTKDLKSDDVKNLIWPYAEEVGKGQVLWPMRYSLSGKDKSPDPFQLTEIIGVEETISRLEKVRDVL